ncbi:MAG: DUF2207 domain-containing protein [Candidatus Aminicenantes bacterium]|nr:DUF2207 domain-containing protein [Candidatus Aminicenantes bacterium]
MIRFKARRKATTWSLNWLALWILFGAASPGLRAAPKDYFFPEVRIAVLVERDGSFLVDEFRTFDFEGSFSAAWYILPLSISRGGHRDSISIEDFQIRDENSQPLRMEASTSGGFYKAEWYFRAADERRTFQIHYRVRKGIISYPDVSELYWQMIGTGWDRPTQNVAVTVTLPEDVANREDILVYGHGPLSGWSEIIDARTARFTATQLAARQFFEVRMIWPAGMVAGVPSSRPARSSIQQEEARFVQETIDNARTAQEAKSRLKKRLWIGASIWSVWLVLGSILWFLIYLHYWKRTGQDYRFSDIPEYFRELPSNLQPALVEVLLREGRPISPRSFTATLFDLARRGYLEFEDRKVEKRGIFGSKEKQETTITLKKEYIRDPGLLPYEKDLLNLLFQTIVQSGGEENVRIELEELQSFLKKNPRRFQSWYQKWAKDIRKKATELTFIEPASLRLRNIFLAVTIPLGVLTLNPPLLLLAGLFIPKIKRRAKPWARENEHWKALDRFLDDFSSFEELPAESYKLWEHYLVFGILFGNAKKILKMLPVILKDERSAVPVWYYGFDRSGPAALGRIAGMVRSIESAATSIHQASTSAAHYSSGGGGGFSGGGGGGGGGSGGGAR